MTAILTLWTVVAGAPGAVFAAEYFTSVEIDRIREAQEVERRIPVLLEIGQTRLAYLDLIEIEEEDDGGGGGRLGRLGGKIVKIISPEAGEHIEEQAKKAEEDQAAQQSAMAEFTRTELLRGYYQALEEAMDNIEDAYERGGGDVRKSIESLKDFTEDTIPLLEQFEPETEFEESALADAIEQAKYALERAEYALTVVPKTERK